MSHTSSPDIATAVAGVRASMADLDSAIASLRQEATRLRTAADSKMALVHLDRAALAREAAAAGESVASAAAGEPVPADQSAFGVLNAVAPAVSQTSTPTAAAEPEGPADGVATEPAAGSDQQTMAVVAELRPDDARDTRDVAAPPAPGELPAARSDQKTMAVVAELRPDDARDTRDLAAPPVPSELPASWDDDEAADDEAFAKFFSDDVEPEPAQRWLLNDL